MIVHFQASIGTNAEEANCTRWAVSLKTISDSRLDRLTRRTDTQ